MIPKSYEGREQTYIKHSLLRSYLERLFMILGQFAKTICYVDCFAGPWQEQNADLKDTSIAISLEIMKKCREGLLKLGRDVCFRALFIEKDKNAYEKLKTFLVDEKISGIEPEAKHGMFHELREEILKWCGPDDFAFFFIDPTGWKDVVEIKTLKPLLQRPHSEYLINFMFDFILRTHSQPAFSEHMQEIFGEKPDTTCMSPQEREEYLITLYLSRLKSAQGYHSMKPRAAYVKVLDPLKNRTKYDLVYLTRHPKGIRVFMDASEKLEFIQKRVRAKAKQNHRISKTGQQELFAPEINDSSKTDEDLAAVKSFWLKRLSDQPKHFGIEQLADMLEETGWFESDFQKAMKALIKDGKANNIDMKRNRPKNAVDFNKGERVRRI